MSKLIRVAALYQTLATVFRMQYDAAPSLSPIKTRNLSDISDDIVFSLHFRSANCGNSATTATSPELSTNLSRAASYCNPQCVAYARNPAIKRFESIITRPRPRFNFFDFSFFGGTKIP